MTPEPLPIASPHEVIDTTPEQVLSTTSRVILVGIGYVLSNPRSLIS